MLSRPTVFFFFFFEKKASTEGSLRALVRDPPAQHCTFSSTKQRKTGSLSALARREGPWSLVVGKKRGGQGGRGAPALEEIALRVDGQTDEESERARERRKREIKQSFALPPRGSPGAAHSPLLAFPYLGAGGREHDHEQGFVGRHGGLREDAHQPPPGG